MNLTLPNSMGTNQLLDEMHQRARRLYEMNLHIFEDEYEALVALGGARVAVVAS